MAKQQRANGAVRLAPTRTSFPHPPEERARRQRLSRLSAASVSVLALAAGPLQAQPFSPSMELSALDGATGLVLNGVADLDRSGVSVAGAGDVNGDGFDDLLIGAPRADPNGSYSGASYLVFGKSGGFGAALELSALDGATGFVLNGVAGGDDSGYSVAGAGDVNGDGFDDLLIGARGADPNGSRSGASYLVFGKSGGFGAALELSALDGATGFVLNGVAANDRSGTSVAGAGDINGDGFDDLLIGARGAGSGDTGASYLVFGKSGGFGAALELSALDGSNGLVLNGVAAYDFSGYSVAGAGDVNGDGFDDLLIGASGADPNGSRSGASYLVFGKSGGFGAALELSALDGSNGLVLNGVAAYDFSGYSVAGAGDVNGDGFDDLLIGAFRAGSGDTGASYLVFGKSGGFGAALELSALDGATGFVLNGVAANDRSGASVAGAGDVNGDGFDDLLIGAPRADPNGSYSGASYLVFGKSGGFGAALELSALDGSNGLVLNGVAAYDRSGYSVAGAGDVNGDGFDDLLIGAFRAGSGDTGASYLVFGRDTTTASASSALYLSSAFSGTVPGNTGAIAFSNEDILRYDLSTNTWSLFFDGSEVGLQQHNVHAFHLLADGGLLLSAGGNLPGPVGYVSGRDIVRFTPTTPGDYSAGAFALYLKGSDVGLSSRYGDHRIEAIGFAPPPDARLLVSLSGNSRVPGAGGAMIPARDEDLLALNPDNTWELYFDGSNVGLSHENINGMWIDPSSGEIYLTVHQELKVDGLDGDNTDVFVCAPGSLGPETTSCTSFSLFWDGSAHGYTGPRVDGIAR